jgi:Ca2+-binding EF-hand superfamily protein
MFKRRGRNLNEEEVTEMIEEMDLNIQNEINFDTFCAIIEFEEESVTSNSMVEENPLQNN